MSSVRIDQASVAEVKSLLGEFADKYKAVLTTSINKTLGTAKTQAAARVGNKVNLKAARIKEDFLVDKANYSKLYGGLYAKDADENRIGLIQYGARQTMKGVTVQILRSKPRFLIPHAFIASRGVKEHVFWRKNRTPDKNRWPSGQKPRVRWDAIDPAIRRPLSLRRGPSVAYWFGKPDVFEPVSIQAQHVYLINVEEKIDEIIRRYHG
jgi:hypothetical protein